MATMELDPLFVKALGFLRSKNKESADQLRELLDDVIAGSGKPKIDKPPTSFGGLKSAEDRSLQKTKRVGESSPLSKADKTRRDVEKRSADRAKLDTSDSDSAPIKKSKVERPQRLVSKPAPVIEDDDDDTEEDSDDSNHDSGKEDTPETNTGGSTDADDFALELGLACVMCKKMDVSAGNNLIECQECHNLYHQQCHKPAATDADPNDPRLVWYCARCARNMKRQASKKPKSLPSSGRDAKGFDKSEESSMNLFKRSEPKTVSPSGSSKQPFTGLAGMAANLSGRPATTASNNKPSKPAAPASISQRSSSSRSSVSSPVSKVAPSSSKQHSSSASSSSKSSGSSTSKGGNSGKAMSQTVTASAMKRLHMMKKKASKR
ncbi:integrator complex subunit 12-like [Amphiura filiformis]|uniref:integrator complex subunit 12-like n=1 Tax=Amphiura filiformis TaxID=82378 RepID=UPI003B219171